MVVPVEPGLHAGSLRAPELRVEALPMGTTSRVCVELLRDHEDRELGLTAIVVRGDHPGPIFGVIGGVQPDDVESTRVVEHWIDQVRVSDLHGTVVAVAKANALGCDIESPTHASVSDLIDVYVHRLCTRVIGQLDFFIELRAATEHIEQLTHARLSLDDAMAVRLAELQHPVALVDDRGSSTTLLATARRLGMTAVTVAVGRVEGSSPVSTAAGLHNALCHLRMQPALESPPSVAPVCCGAARWIEANEPADVESLPPLGAIVEEGEPLALLRRHTAVETVCAPCRCIVLARCASPHVGASAPLVEIAPVLTDARQRGAKQPARREPAPRQSDPRNDQNKVYRSRSS